MMPPILKKTVIQILTVFNIKYDLQVIGQTMVHSTTTTQWVKMLTTSRL